MPEVAVLKVREPLTGCASLKTQVYTIFIYFIRSCWREANHFLSTVSASFFRTTSGDLVLRCIAEGVATRDGVCAYDSFCTSKFLKTRGLLCMREDRLAASGTRSS